MVAILSIGVFEDRSQACFRTNNTRLSREARRAVPVPFKVDHSYTLCDTDTADGIDSYVDWASDEAAVQDWCSSLLTDQSGLSLTLQNLQVQHTLLAGQLDTLKAPSGRAYPVCFAVLRRDLVWHFLSD